jgi:hypothetical protein
MQLVGAKDERAVDGAALRTVGSRGVAVVDLVGHVGGGQQDVALALYLDAEP